MSQQQIGLVFPGQGTQKQGMGEPWRDTPSWAIVAEVSEVVGEDLSELLLDTPAETLRRTDLAQLSVFTVSLIAHAEAVRRDALGGEVIACAGHSLGEYTALTAAGALSVPAAAKLVAARGRAMREAARDGGGTMGALVAAPLEKVEELVAAVRAKGEEVWVANINAPGQTVVSGSVDGVGQVALEAPEYGAKFIRMQVGGAFHSPYMAPAAEALTLALKETGFAARHVPVVANIDARAHDGDCDWPDHGTRQLTSPVRWEESVRTLTETLGCRRLVELGPGRAMAGLIRRIAPGTEVVSLDAPSAMD
ncbi:ACP S-malonyltransferase [Streptomyces sp. P38-E01]|uniref:Malonyl CoA-acyl carrier protein transacylase n=1 Tax=Streptomyces tardus TaxID=2780544 RepID=A0A949JCH1_9ACTN|nr:ACP S-malonyltransferase [Streptomyces tardus]MBU7597326.1 ACP S-malonyltransferase [Streptomyces tardus]